jgi:hypothetical protein
MIQICDVYEIEILKINEVRRNDIYLPLIYYINEIFLKFNLDENNDLTLKTLSSLLYQTN